MKKLTLIIVLLSVGLFGASLVDAKRYYVPGSKTEKNNREYKQKKANESYEKARRMLHDDLDYNETKSSYKYRDARRKLDIQKREKELGR